MAVYDMLEALRGPTWPRLGLADLLIAWDATGGNPGGSARITVDTPSSWAWFSAPAQFLGDKSALLNQGTIRFDEKRENGSWWLAPDIVIAGAGMVLRTPPGSFRQPGQWTSVQGPLIPSGAWWGCVSGEGCDVTPEISVRPHRPLAAGRVPRRRGRHTAHHLARQRGGDPGAGDRGADGRRPPCGTGARDAPQA